MTDVIGPTEVNADIETRAEADPKPESSRFWLGEISASKKRDAPWHKRGSAVVKQFRDERERDGDERKANILWSNTEILKGALFQGMTNPDVRRKYPRKGKDERAARTVAIVMERALSSCQDSYNISGAIECAVEDCVLPGRGTCWVVYEADVEDRPHEVAGGADEMAGQKPAEPYIAGQTVRIDHVYWQDYLTSAGRKEADIWWKARRHLYSRDELKRYFPDHGEKVPLGAEIDMGDVPKGEKDDTFKRAEVWEIWDKVKKQRVYVADGYDFLLKPPDADPYRLQSFFPAPEPLYAIKTTSSLVPVPHYTQYQDQVSELNEITTRIARNVEALKRRGVYDASMEGGDNKLSGLMSAGDNEFVPYKGFAALMEKGGLKNVFQAEDLTVTIQVVQALYQERATLIQTIYEITGISDILRGASNPNETATAQRLKGQMGSLRLQKWQTRVQEFIRDLYRIKAEIMAEHFTREKLVEMTGIDMPLLADVQQAQMVLQQVQAAQQISQAQPGKAPGMQAPMPAPNAIAEAERIAKQVPWEDIERILRSDERRAYKIDVETDSTARSDDLEQKQARIEFLTSIQGFMTQALPAAMSEPKLMPLVKELTLFGVRAFKIGRGLEEAFDDAFDSFQRAADAQAQQPPQGPPPDPKAEAMMAKTKADIEAKQAEAQLRAQTAAIDNQIKQQKAASDQARDAAEVEGKKIDNETKRMMAEMQMMLAEQKAQIAQMQADMKMGQTMAKAMQPVNGAMQ